MTNLWGVLWHSKCKLDGVNEHIMNDDDCLPVLFRKRYQARAWIKEHYGYIKERKDLRQEPHGWRMPIAIKVRIEVVREA